MYKDGVITIGEWPKGMGDSAYNGNYSIVNCEVFDTPGVLKVGSKTELYNTATLTGVPIAYCSDQYGNTFYMTSDAKVYINNAYSNDLGTFGWDLCIYNDYLIASRAGGLDCYGPLSSSPQWFSGWKSIGTDAVALSSSYYLKLIPARDGNLYITNGAYMAKISGFSGGTPTVAPTATLVGGSMSLPANNAGVSAVEIGSYMLIGTQALNGSWFNATNSNVANLYLWDKADTKPISLTGALNEQSIQSMVSYGNRVYIMAGTRGNLYMTDTASFTKVKRLPWNQNKLFSSTMRVYPNAMTLNQQGNLLVGTATLQDSFNPSDPNPVKHGVYEIALSDKYPVIFKNTISTGNKGQSNVLKIGFLATNGDETIIGWQDGSTYGVDKTNQILYTSASFESELYQIAPRTKRKSFSNLEFLLGKPLLTGQSIVVYFRKNLTDSYTTIGTFSYSTLGGVISHNTSALIKDTQLVQVKIDITIPLNSYPYSNLELINLSIW